MGLAASLLHPGTSQSKTMRIIVADSIVGHQFIQGAQSVSTSEPEAVLLATPTLSFIQKYQALLSTPNAERWIGVVDNASALLMFDLARSEGAYIHWDQYYGLGSNNVALQLGMLLAGGKMSDVEQSSSQLLGDDYVAFIIETKGRN